MLVLFYIVVPLALFLSFIMHGVQAIKLAMLNDRINRLDSLLVSYMASTDVKLDNASSHAFGWGSQND